MCIILATTCHLYLANTTSGLCVSLKSIPPEKQYIRVPCGTFQGFTHVTEVRIKTEPLFVLSFSAASIVFDVTWEAVLSFSL